MALQASRGIDAGFYAAAIPCGIELPAPAMGGR